MAWSRTSGGLYVYIDGPTAGAASTIEYHSYGGEMRHAEDYFERQRAEHLAYMRVGWLPQRAQMPAPVNLRKPYQRSFRGRLFGIGKRK
jgi:hypothetical protein